MAVMPQPLPRVTRATPMRYVRDILWAVRIIAGAAILLAGGAMPVFRHHIWFIVLLSLITIPVRSARFGTIYNFFLIGGFNAVAIFGLQYVLEKMILGGEYKQLGSVVIAPVTEEIFKVAPLVVLLLIRRLPFRYGFGATDLMICGAALGSAFGFIEDLIRLTDSFPEPVSPSLFGTALFNDSYNSFIGHGGATAFIALAMGWLIYASRWKKLIWLGLLAFGLVVYWMMADHGLANLRTFGREDEWFFLLRWTYRLDLNGALSPWVLTGALLITMIVERIMLFYVTRPLPKLGIRRSAAFIVRPFRQGVSYAALRASWIRLRRLLLYVLTVRQLGYLVAHARGDSPVPRAIAPLMVRRAKEVAVTQVLVRTP